MFMHRARHQRANEAFFGFAPSIHHSWLVILRLIFSVCQLGVELTQAPRFSAATRQDETAKIHATRRADIPIRTRHACPSLCTQHCNMNSSRRHLSISNNRDACHQPTKPTQQYPFGVPSAAIWTSQTHWCASGWSAYQPIGKAYTRLHCHLAPRNHYRCAQSRCWRYRPRVIEDSSEQCSYLVMYINLMIGYQQFGNKFI